MALRRLTSNTNLISATLLRSLSTAPPFSRSIHTTINNDSPSNHGPTPIPSLSPSSSNIDTIQMFTLPDVFDSLAPSARSVTQSQLMNQLINKQAQKCNPLLSSSGFMGIGATGVRSWGIQNALHLNMHKNDGVKVEMKRSFSTSADQNIQSNANTTRPLSPHLPVYKPQTNSVASIFNRISGAYLAALIAVFYFLTMKIGVISFTYYPFYLLTFYASKFTLFSAELAALALAYHVFHSLPHLAADFKAILFLKRRT